jgi:WD40 repeat protein
MTSLRADGKRADVFISYRHRDPTMSWVRGPLLSALESAGLRVVVDFRDFIPGVVLVDAMEAAAANSRVTIAVVDASYRDSGFTDLERSMSERLIAVIAADVQPECWPPADEIIDLHGSVDPAPVIDAVRAVIKRVYILEAEQDEQWVEGVLVPTLEDADVVVEHSGEIAPGEVFEEAVERGIDRADRVVVVLSAAYLRDLSRQADRLVKHVEALDQQVKLLPVQLEADLDIPPRLKSRLIIDASKAEMWDATIRQICDVLDVPLPATKGAPECPYPGMRPFTDAQAANFFGRDDDIIDVISTLRRRNFAAVIGPSGSGKSSMVAAGVIPRLQANGLDGDPCAVSTIRPGASPATSLHEGLSLLQRATAEGGGGATRRVLVIDQLEEAFASGPTAVAEFFDALVAAQRDDQRLAVIVIARADFYDELMNSASWPTIAPNRIELAPIRGEDLRDAIRLPARQVRVVVEDALVERLVAETEGQPGLLPFLQETLRGLWDRLHWRLLTLDEYVRANAGESDGSGVLHSIRRESEAALAEIASRHTEGERNARAILVRLVQFGDGVPDTRRQVRLDELAAAASDPEAFRIAYESLVAHRIVTPGSRLEEADATSGDAPAGASVTAKREVAVVDLSHEAIIRGWPRLASWLAADRSVELARRRWLDRAEDHAAGTGSLLSGNDLRSAEVWLDDADEAGAAVEPMVRDFVAASRRDADRASRRRRRVLVAAAAAGVVLAALFAFLAAESRQSQHRAEREADERVANDLRTSAASYSDGIALPAILVRAADVISPSPGSGLQMLATAERSRPIAWRLDAPDRNVGFEAMALADDHSAVGDGIGGVAVWDGNDRSSRRTADVGNTVLAMARRRDSTVLAIGSGHVTADASTFESSEGAVHLVDLADLPLRTERITLPSDTAVSALAFDDDLLFVGQWDGSVTALDTRQPSTPVVKALAIGTPADASAPPGADAGQAECTSPDDRRVSTFAVDGARRWLAAAASNCTITVWNLADLTRHAVLVGHTDRVRGLAFVPGTDELLSTGDDGTIVAWKLEDAAAPAPTTLAVSPVAERAVTMCISPTGSSVITAGRDHVVRRWLRGVDGSLTADPNPYSSHVSTVRGVVCPSDTTFASVAGDGIVYWDLHNPPRTGLEIANDDAAIVDATVRPGARADIAIFSGDALAVSEPGGGPPRLLRVPGLNVSALAYTADGEALVVGGRLRSNGHPGVTAYDADSLLERWSVSLDGTQSVVDIDALDVDHVVVGTSDGDAGLIVGGERGPVVALPTRRPVTAVAIAPHGQLVVADLGGTVFCVDPQRPDDTPSIELGRTVNGLDVTSDGTVLAGTSDGVLRSYRRALSSEGSGCTPADWTVASLPVVHDAIEGLQGTLDGTIVVAANSEGTAEIWDVLRSRLVGTLSLPSTDGDGATRVAVTPDGTTIVVSGAHHAVVYRVDRDTLREQLCALAGRNLTADEERTFVPRASDRDAARCDG